MKRILDTHALMAFLEKEPGYQKMEAYLVSALEKNNYLLMTTVNLGEAYYMVLRECGPAKAQEIEKIVHTLPIEIIAVDWPLAKEAARFKARGQIAYADCFAAALAKLNKGEVITGDQEFKAVEKEVKVAWLG